MTILFLTITVSQGQTNVYHPLPDSNATWYEHIYGGVPPNVYYNDYSLFISGDTIIGSYSYHKLYATGYWTYGGGSMNYYSNEYRGSFRQDTLQKKVFFISDTSLHEELLYDFNLDVGDTLPEAYNNYYNSNKVIEIDSILVGCVYHKIFYLAPLSDTGYLPNEEYAIIEGVGSTLGLYPPIMMGIEAGSQLYYFVYNGQYYPTTCGVFVPEIESKNLGIEIFPNPFSTTTTIKINGSMNFTDLTIYNSFGQQVKQIKNISRQTIVLHRDNMPSGIYLLQLTRDNEILTTDKIIITDN